jgi:hypothetical protein
VDTGGPVRSGFGTRRPMVTSVTADSGEPFRGVADSGPGALRRGRPTPA